ncbi:hypothetical protein [Rhizobium leguminosarum]|uniref:hypothetical protein n=1 Tax=Rhizobium leguminosarum TaxID=384 RepID=UPI000FEC97D9|nr:hypothetical protein [Rhizobium leguminosarum]RWX22846.1 hypothetical protein EHI43_34915 [Rhizobium leguminosarum]
MRLKYRLLSKGVPPRRTELVVPGWAGERKLPRDGATPQPWHCQPFTEGSLYGLELLYPYDTSCEVVGRNGQTEFVGDFSHEVVPGLVWPPFRIANPGHYSLGTLIDLQVPQGYALRIEPHPKFFNDRTGTTPVAVIGNLQTAWWPMYFFATFKSPLDGQSHIFRRGEPYAQVIVVPARSEYEVEPMTPDEASGRETQARQIMRHRDEISRHRWISSDGFQFDDVYKQISRRTLPDEKPDDEAIDDRGT